MTSLSSSPVDFPQDLSKLVPFESGNGPMLMAKLREMSALGSVQAVVAYDRDVFMPEGASEDRPPMEEVLEKLCHRLETAPDYAHMVEELFEVRDQLPAHDQRNITLLKENLDRERKLPEAFVAEKANVIAASTIAWETAKERGDFKMMAGFLEKIMDLHRQESEYVGYEQHPYDAHLHKFEPGTRLAEIEPVILGLAEKLAPLISQIQSRQSGDDCAPLLKLPNEIQLVLARQVAADLGYDFSRGRIDTYAHPYCSHISLNDMRIVTRFEVDPIRGIFTIAHEVGHSLYAQGLPRSLSATPIAESASWGMDESQSRIVENNIGRSLPFCHYIYNLLKAHSGQDVSGITPEKIWQKVNRVQPSLIRVDADEVTYNLHIAIRTLLEKDLLTGKLPVRELPDAWSAMYDKYLGIKPQNHTEGVLQDLHWYGGDMGYFPTYTDGNLWAAGYHQKMRQDIPDLDSQIASGDFSGMRQWLRGNIHQHGALFPSLELSKHITGVALSEEPFLRYIKEKFQIAD